MAHKSCVAGLSLLHFNLFTGGGIPSHLTYQENGWSNTCTHVALVLYTDSHALRLSLINQARRSVSYPRSESQTIYVRERARWIEATIKLLHNYVRAAVMGLVLTQPISCKSAVSKLLNISVLN